MTAKSVIDVILGEAKAGSYEDMLAIASVIENRAKQLGVSPEEVVSVRSEFNAYGKSLPSGVDKYRRLASQALQQVRTNGPVHDATFYATPSATKHLPGGLKEVSSTDGHKFFSDPQNRSIKTSSGYRSPETVGLFSYAETGPTPPERTPQTGQQAINAMMSGGRSSMPLEDRPMAGFIESYGPKRPNTPASGIQGVVRGVVGEILGPDYTVRGISGQGDYGAAHRHPTGKALDYDIVDPGGNVVTDPGTLADITKAIAARTGGSTGYANDGGYMGLGRIHSDFVKPQAPGSAGWSRAHGYNPITGAEAIQGDLYDAAWSGGVPVNKPVPSQRLFASPPAVEATADGYGPLMANANGGVNVAGLFADEPTNFAAVQPTMSDGLELFTPSEPQASETLSYGPSQRLGPRGLFGDSPEISLPVSGGPSAGIGGLASGNIALGPEQLQQSPLQPLPPAQTVQPRQVAQPQEPQLDLVPNAAPSVADSVSGYGLFGDAGDGYSYGYSPWGSGVAKVHDSADDRTKIAASGPGLFGAFNKEFGTNIGLSPGKMMTPLASALGAGAAVAGLGPLALAIPAANALGGTNWLASRLDAVPREQWQQPRQNNGFLSNLFNGNPLQNFGGGLFSAPQKAANAVGGLFGGNSNQNEVSFNGPIGRNQRDVSLDSMSQAARNEIERATRGLY